MIRVGVVGCNYGRLVHVPAFRTDRRCEVAALVGSDAARTRALAEESGIAAGFDDWRRLVEDDAIAALSIATPPRLQAEIARHAVRAGKAVFLEKPLAAHLAEAETLAGEARRAGVAAMVDFEFTEVVAWRKAKALIDEGALGHVRQVVVNWSIENRATRDRHVSWKTSGDAGGGVLGNFASHTVHYLEWFCGPIAGLSARLFQLRGEPRIESGCGLTVAFASGAAGVASIGSGCYAGSGHRLEFYGEDGALVLANPTEDYMRGFCLSHAKRGEAPRPIAADDALDRNFADGRVAPVARLMQRFLDAVERGGGARPGIEDGLRAQRLLDAARRSHAEGRWIEVPA